MYLGLGVISFFIPIPINRYKSEIIKLLKEETGNDFEIKGKASFRILPTPKITLKDVWLNGAPEQDQMSLKLKLTPLLKGKLKTKLEV